MNIPRMLILVTTELDESEKVYEEIAGVGTRQDPLLYSFSLELLRHVKVSREVLRSYVELEDQAAKDPDLGYAASVLYSVVLKLAGAWGVLDLSTMELRDGLEDGDGGE